MDTMEQAALALAAEPLDECEAVGAARDDLLRHGLLLGRQARSRLFEMGERRLDATADTKAPALDLLRIGRNRREGLVLARLCQHGMHFAQAPPKRAGEALIDRELTVDVDILAGHLVERSAQIGGRPFPHVAFARDEGLDHRHHLLLAL